tara:strand:+ start:344 stop:649 length:306 start_codon:yes stop_codon:yes gene_type:complete
MAHTITAEQDIIEALNIKAAMWANRILTRKINNEQCKFEIAQQTRVRKYLNAGLVTEATFKTAAQEQIHRIRQQAKKSLASTQSTSGSKDGLWSKKLAGKK